MKNIIVLLSVFLLVLTACATTQTVQEVQPVEETREVLEEKRASLDDIMAEVKSNTEANNQKFEEIHIPVPLVSGKVGDFVVFGVNFNQVNKREATYYADILALEGRDKGNNRISIDKTIVTAWGSPAETADFTLGVSESAFVPIVIKIGPEIKSGVPTEVGTYKFDVRFYQRGAGYNRDLDDLTKTLYLRVE